MIIYFIKFYVINLNFCLVFRPFINHDADWFLYRVIEKDGRDFKPGDFGKVTPSPARAHDSPPV